ncbi:MAG: GNAT family N-acetyltransferase [Anaerolineae bacterium]|nr:GNAT family N-acetyltransferase [Anaerolineae bacterium]
MPLNLAALKEKYPEKFGPEGKAFKHIRRGDTLFIGTGCGQPQYLVQALVNYVQRNPAAFYDVEVFHMWPLGVAPYTNDKFKANFRHNTFFISESTREAVNAGLADYTPIFLSQTADLFHRKLIPIDVALIQTTLPDEHGFVNLGVSVDVTKAAIESANYIIAQVNAHLPRIPGDGFLHVEDIDFFIAHDEPLIEYQDVVDDVVIEQMGRYLANLIEDGDTLQIGYGSTPNAILPHLAGKMHLGVHTELLTDGIIDLMRKGVVDNSRKTVNRGRTVATFCMGTKSTYEFLHNNPAIEFRTADYTNNPLLIARQENMVAINSALEVDLTGQASSESIGKMFYRGIGGQADFMRGAVLAPNGKTILALPSTAENDTVSRIIPMLQEGAGVTFNRSDIHYIVTEYGIAYLHGKNIRERAMDLIAIAHPKFRPWLIEEAKKANLIYQDQAFIPGKAGEYPVKLETFRQTKSGLEIFLRPVKISDEPLLKDFFYSLSDASLQSRFMSMRTSMPHEELQHFVVIDYTRDMVILAIVFPEEEKEEVIGIGQYSVNTGTHTADAAFAVRDEFQGHGIGTELISYLTYLAKKRGILGFTADVLSDNWGMLRSFDKMGYDTKRTFEGGTYRLDMMFKRDGVKKHS